MEADAVLELDYETQYFGFHPRGFVDGVYNVIQNYLRESLDSMQAFLAEEFKNVISQKEVQDKAQAIMQTLSGKLDKITDRLEVYINRNVFHIPSHVVLPEDRIHLTNPTTDEQMQTLDQEISEIKSKILQEKYKKAMLQSKIQQQQLVKSRQTEFFNRYQLLMQLAADCGISDLHESIAYNLNKTTKLFEVLQHVLTLVSG